MDGLSGNSQRELIKAKIRPGCVLHLYCDFIHNPAEKFIVVVAIDYDYDILLVFLVNSRIPPFIYNDEDLRACQVEFPWNPEEYSFLEYDSYINCSEVFDNLEIDDVISHIRDHPSDYKCKLNDAELQRILEAVRIAPTIPDYDKELIFEALEE